MKVTADQLALLRSKIEPLDTNEHRTMYREGRFPRADRVKDLDRRYRWDLFHAAGSTDLIPALYDSGCNDNHIDTALRRIVPPL